MAITTILRSIDSLIRTTRRTGAEPPKKERSRVRKEIRRFMERAAIGDIQEISRMTPTEVEAQATFLNEMSNTLLSDPELAAKFSELVFEAYFAEEKKAEIRGRAVSQYSWIFLLGLFKNSSGERFPWMFHVARRYPKLLEYIIFFLIRARYWLNVNGQTPKRADFPWECDSRYLEIPPNEKTVIQNLTEIMKELDDLFASLIQFLGFCQAQEEEWQCEVDKLSRDIRENASAALREDGEDYIQLDVRPLMLFPGVQIISLVPRPGAQDLLDIDLTFYSVLYGHTVGQTFRLSELRSFGLEPDISGFVHWLAVKAMHRVMVTGSNRGKGRETVGQSRETTGQGQITHHRITVRSHKLALPEGMTPDPEQRRRGQLALPGLPWDKNPNWTFRGKYERGQGEEHRKPILTFSWKARKISP